MADIIREVDDDLQQERLERLWKTYSPYALAIMVALVLGTAARVGWNSWTEAVQADRGQRLMSALEESKQSDSAAATEELARLAADSGGGYPMLARFYEAKMQAKDGRIDLTIELLEAIARDGNVERTYRDLAILYVGMYRLDAGQDPLRVKTSLAPLLDETNPWRHLAGEATALALLEAGQADGARSLLENLAADATAPQGLRGRARELVAGLRKPEAEPAENGGAENVVENPAQVPAEVPADNTTERQDGVEP